MYTVKHCLKKKLLQLLDLVRTLSWRQTRVAMHINSLYERFSAEG